MKRFPSSSLWTGLINKPSLSFAFTVALSVATAGSSVLPMARAADENPANTNADASVVPQTPMRAVPGVRFDLWIAALAKAKELTAISPSAAQLTDAVRGLVESKSDTQVVYQNLLKLALNLSLNDAKAHLDLADALFAARNDMRVSHLGINERHQRMTLLQFLGEETLFFVSQKFPGQVKEYKKAYSKIPDSLRSSIASSDLRGIEVMTGDVVLSKFSGTGSSSFIALSANRQGLFSHAAAVYIDPSNGELQTPEAFIEDGVKLRTMKSSYIDQSKTRMFVYRGSEASAVETDRRLRAAAKGVTSFVDDMKSRVQDPATQASFPYNFSMDPENGNGGFTCTETVLESYKRGGLKGTENAYAKSVWSSFPEESKQVLSEFLEMKAPKFPAPGDLDLNPSFDLVGFRIDVEKLAQDRVEMAAIDVLLALIAQNHEQVREQLKVFDNVGERAITQAQLDYIKSLKFIPEDARKKITDTIPANINIKQLVFFGYLNEVFTPQVREAMLKDAQEFQAMKGRPVGLNELRSLAVRHTVQHIEKMKMVAQEFAKKAKAAGFL